MGISRSFEPRPTGAAPAADGGKTRRNLATKWINMSERIARLMKEKGLGADIDFYSATVYYSLGIPTDLFRRLRYRALRRLVRARSRTTRGQPSLSPAERIHRRTSRKKSHSDRRADVVVPRRDSRFALAALGIP
jgi:hypothetical protein